MPSFIPADAAVWFEIPVTDLASGKAFYEAVTEMSFDEMDGGGNRMEVFKARDDDSVRGHLYPGKPATPGTGITIHLAVRELEPAMERVTAHGGQVVSPPIAIPSGRFAYCLDPDGNSFGIFAA